MSSIPKHPFRTLALKLAHLVYMMETQKIIFSRRKMKVLGQILLPSVIQDFALSFKFEVGILKLTQATGAPSLHN